ncbi:hypothetical protein DI383_10520 [Flavobacteriaceae bacterium LYZ1037]|nr:hypothetical protein DI383_10520 [Flavobacteriaceae bacterium LYZ1037]
MKKNLLLITVLILGGLSVSATTTNKPSHVDNATTLRGYGNSFIFVENGVEFSIFPDGQFDFYMPSYGPNVNVSAPGISISFNSGYDYNPFLQYDEFGAIIQVEHVPVYYDYYGRVSQIGNVFINYNSFGYVTRIGGLYIHYNPYRRYSHYTGFINAYNPYYVYRPWHTYYRVPAYNHCVVYNKPYRKYYKPVRYTYAKPYANNYRRTTAVASRRGTTVTRRSELATRPTKSNNISRQDVRRDVGTVKPRTRNQVATKPNRSENIYRSRESSKMNTSRVNSRENTKSRKSSTVKSSPVATKLRTQTRDHSKTRVVKNNAPERKPKTLNNRTYNKSNNRQVASNTRNKR